MVPGQTSGGSPLKKRWLFVRRGYAKFGWKLKKPKLDGSRSLSRPLRFKSLMWAPSKELPQNDSLFITAKKRLGMIVIAGEF